MSKAFLHGTLADTDPGNIPLTDMHCALSIVDKMVNLALKDRLIVFRKLPAGYLNDYCQR